MPEEFPGLLEKIARLENRCGELQALAAQHEENAARHAGHWTLRLLQDGHERGRWHVDSDGAFEWEGDGIRIALSKVRD